MKSFATADFWKAYAKLPPEMQEQARKAYRLWQENSLYPSLHFKKVGKNLWSARVMAVATLVRIRCRGRTSGQ